MTVEWLISAGTAFALIATVELPDKTFVATLVLATRYRPLPVWLGVATAFAVQCALAVAAGGLVSLLPAQPVRLVAAALFAVGAVVMFRGARRAGIAEQEQEREYAQKVGAAGAGGWRGGWRAFATSFLVLFTAEWGDLSQLFTAGLVASGEPPVAVLAGAWGGLAVVSGAAVLAGRWIVRRVRLSIIRYAAALVCAALAAVTTVSALA